MIARTGAAAALLVAALVAAPRASADDTKDLKETARAIAKKTAKAVVTARLAIKVTVGDREPIDQKIEVTGTVIDPSGLMVVPASAIDPTAAVGRFGGGRRGGGGGGGDQMRVETEVSETAIVGEDGTEFEADVVLKDTELDLAFIKPRDASLKFDYVDLSKGADRAPEALDDIFCVARLGRAGNRSIALATGQIRAVVKGAHGFYVPDNEVASGHAGCVAYAADGTPLGILAVRTVRTEGGATPGGRNRGDAIVVIRPCSDIVDLAKQAKEKKVEKKAADDDKKPEKKTEKKSDDKKPDNKKKDDDF